MSQSEKADKQLQVITIWQGTQRPRKLGSDEMYNPSPMSTVKQKKSVLEGESLGEIRLGVQAWPYAVEISADCHRETLAAGHKTVFSNLSFLDKGRGEVNRGALQVGTKSSLRVQRSDDIPRTDKKKLGQGSYPTSQQPQ